MNLKSLILLCIFTFSLNSNNSQNNQMNFFLYSSNAFVAGCSCLLICYIKYNYCNHQQHVAEGPMLEIAD